MTVKSSRKFSKVNNTNVEKNQFEHQRRPSVTMQRGVDLGNQDLEDDEIQILCSKNRPLSGINFHQEEQCNTIGNIREIDLSTNCLSPTSIEHFVQGNWVKLATLRLYENQIGSKGCKFLSEADMPNLIWLNLTKNSIDSNGALHLSKAQWKNLEHLQLNENKMANNSIRQLIKGNWSKLAVINTEENNLKYFECKNLVLGEYPKIKSLILPVYFEFKPMTQKDKDELIRLFRIKFGRVKIQI